jgi:ribosomal protein L40E
VETIIVLIIVSYILVWIRKYRSEVKATNSLDKIKTYYKEIESISKGKTSTFVEATNRFKFTCCKSCELVNPIVARFCPRCGQLIQGE